MVDNSSTIIITEELYKSLIDPEKEAWGYIIICIGSACNWEDEVDHDCSKLKSKTFIILDLGYQYFDKKVRFVQK